MNKTKGVIYGIGFLIVLTCLWFVRRHIDTRVDRSITSQVLPKDDKEKLIIDVKHHTIEVLNRKSNGETQIQKKYLNPRGATAIEEKKDGTLILTQRSFGTEGQLFAGVALGSDVHLRGAFGVNVFYIHSFDLGTGILFSSDIKDTRIMADVSYNWYSNLSVGVYVDHHKDVGVLATIRF